jgi:hypothetical protein
MGATESRAPINPAAAIFNPLLVLRVLMLLTPFLTRIMQRFDGYAPLAVAVA